MLDSGTKDGVLTRQDTEDKLVQKKTNPLFNSFKKIVKEKDEFLRFKMQTLPEDQAMKLREKQEKVTRMDFKNYFVHLALDSDSYDPDHVHKEQTLSSILESLRDSITVALIYEVNKFIDENQLDDSHKL